MNDEKTSYKLLGYTALVILFVCFLFAGFGKRGRTLEELQTNTDTTVGNLKAESSILAVEIGRSQISNDKAKEYVERTRVEIGDSRKLADTISAGVVELERLINESQGLARANSAIIESVDESN